MEEIDAASARIERESPPRVQRPTAVPRLDALEELWDVWEREPITSHRGWSGKPVVWLKKALLTALGPANRELLRRQRQYNRAVLDELTQLRSQLARVSGELAALRRSRSGKE
jgi:hypothetical protein